MNRYLLFVQSKNKGKHRGRNVQEYKGLVVKHLVMGEVYEMNEVFVGLLKAQTSKCKCHDQTLISVGICSLGFEV